MPMSEQRLLICRARFVLPLAAPDRTLRIHDGYVLAQGEHILEAGPYRPETGRRLLAAWGDRLEILHTRREIPSADPIAMQDMLLIPAFVKAHGHDHEQPLIGIAKDEPLTDWLDHAVNPFTGYLNSHRDELAVRAALGAGRWRLMRQFLTESLVVSLFGGALGLLVAYGSLAALKVTIPPGIMPPNVYVSMDARVLLFVLVVSVLTGVVFGIFPALKATRPDLTTAIKVAGHHELGLLAKAFNKMIQQISETQLQLAQADKLASVGRLAAGIAHEINNPLTGVLTYASLMAKRLPPEDPGSEDVAAAARSSRNFWTSPGPPRLPDVRPISTRWCATPWPW